ncbi:MAG: hypothetical protein ACKOYQ_04645 [Actinomycetota bacterium]
MRRRLSTAKVLVAGIVGALLVSMLLAPAASSVAPVPAAGVPTAPATSIDSADPVATPTSSSIALPSDPLAQALSRSRPIDLRADDPDLTVIAGLKRDSTALDIRATKASNPDEIEYRDFMSLSEAGQAYGASAATLKKLRSAAKRAGVRVQVDPSRLLARFTAPVSVWEKLYDSKGRVSQPTATYPYRVYSIVKDKQIAGAPADFKGLVSEWAAIYIQYVASADVPGVDPQQKTDLQELAASAGSPLAWPTNTGTLPPGTCDAKVLRDKAVFAPAQIRKAYRSTSLSARGMRGAGTSLTVLSLGGGFAQADLDRAAACFGYKQPPVSIALGTGLAEPFVNATIETHLDLITVSSVMPEAETIRLVEVSEAQISFIDGIARALNVDGKGTDSPDVVSISYGMCESQLVPYMKPYLALSEDLLRMAALVGTSVIAAAGDYGSSMCGAQEALEVGPTVWYPASSPWATAVGGTRLEITADNTRANEVVWNDYPFVGGPAATPPTAAGGGGPSSLFARPWYQGGATPAGPRAVPDVALLGAMRPGWPIVYGDQVFTVGGTSGGTPFLGANLALMAAQQSVDGYPGFGFVNPWLYKAAAKTPSPFYDVTIGANSVQMIGCCSAYAGYDMASGLGVPMMDALFKSIPYPAG